MNNEMMLDFKNRVRNMDMKVTDLWYPLFEAVANSIHAIQEKNKNTIGTITILIKRKETTLYDALGEVDSIWITDDGIGFNQENEKAFRTSDTSKKLRIGGKGVGRFTWVKVFHSAVIDSVYFEKDTYKKRHIIFTDDGVISNSVKVLKKTANFETTVRLLNMIS